MVLSLASQVPGGLNWGLQSRCASKFKRPNCNLSKTYINLQFRRNFETLMAYHLVILVTWSPVAFWLRYTQDRIELRLENVDRDKVFVLELLVARLEYRMYATEPN